MRNSSFFGQEGTKGRSVSHEEEKGIVVERGEDLKENPINTQV